MYTGLKTRIDRQPLDWLPGMSSGRLLGKRSQYCPSLVACPVFYTGVLQFAIFLPARCIANVRDFGIRSVLTLLESTTVQQLYDQ